MDKKDAVSDCQIAPTLWIFLSQKTNYWRVLLKKAINFLRSKSQTDFLARWGTIKVGERQCFMELVGLS
jgi:hypothetical protein